MKASGHRYAELIRAHQRLARTTGTADAGGLNGGGAGGRPGFDPGRPFPSRSDETATGRRCPSG